jgi:hypothetical protein
MGAGRQPLPCGGVPAMKRKPTTPMPGGEALQQLEPLTLPVRSGVPVVRLTPAGDGVDQRLLPVASPKRTTSFYPTVSEFKELPRWAKVAFLARNARRVEPLCLTMPDEWKAHYLYFLTKAVGSAEQAASTGTELDSRILKDLRLAAKAAHESQADSYIAVYAMQAPVTYAVDHGIGQIQYWKDANWTAAESALLQISSDPSDLRWFRRDFDRLLHFARQHHWTDETPVPADLLGPLWPEGREPAWFTDIANYGRQHSVG